ncbi:MAG: efflux RND transporter periplasmic adaptor subunit [Candidatus Glassbacteria bacterium]
MIPGLKVRLISLLVGGALIVACACAAKEEPSDREAARTGSITETGELQAVNNRAVTMPWFNFDYGQPQINFLEKEGTVVRKGQLVADIDVAGVRKVLEDKKSNLEIEQAELEKIRVDQENQIKQLEANLNTALAALDKARIDSMRVRYEPESRRRVIELELSSARIRLRKAQKKIEDTRLIQEQDFKIQLAKLTRIRNDIATAERTIENFNLKAPADGMVVYGRNSSTREKVKVGDKIWPGEPVITLPDLTRMKVKTTINETEVAKITTGQNVIIRLDSYPKISFEGTITSISNVCHSVERGSKIKVFDVEVLINQNHRLLKPGMTVSCEFLPVS